MTPAPLIYTAPGKVVLWGEYAVLAGAPAAVMSVNRLASVTLTPQKNRWRFSSRGFLTPGVDKATAEFCRAPAAAMVEAVLNHWGYTEYATTVENRPFSLFTDSSAFFHAAGEKLGIGSSAAVCVATYQALCKWLGRTPALSEAIDIHRSFQGGRGSGLDIAASWHGEVIRFQQDTAEAWQWPEQLHWQIVWTRTSAATAGSLGDFNNWYQQTAHAELDDLADRARALFEQPDLANLSAYTQQLQVLDNTAELNIFTPEHRRLATIAAAHGLIYKPCGAGGGDIGLACGLDPHALQAFATAAGAEQFVPLDLEIARHGVEAG